MENIKFGSIFVDYDTYIINMVFSSVVLFVHFHFCFMERYTFVFPASRINATNAAISTVGKEIKPARRECFPFRYHNW